MFNIKIKKTLFSLLFASIMLTSACSDNSSTETTTENTTNTIENETNKDEIMNNITDNITSDMTDETTSDMTDETTSDMTDETTSDMTDETTSETVDENATAGKEDLSIYFENIALTESHKNIGKGNPLYSQRYGADPFVLSYNGRVYIYMTADNYDYDDEGNIKENNYGQIRTLNVISSEDLVNWTDHGWIPVNGSFGVTKAGSNSWAPAAAYKNIDGVDKFFVYYANGANGIGVLVSDSPTGPFTNPLGDKLLIDRKTPNCQSVTWLFDPAVFVDDDGRAYMYFGGGIPGEEYASPKTARVVELGADMISLANEPVTIDAPYLFEDAGVNKVGDKYLFSYCTNWNIGADGQALGIGGAVISYMESDNPMGPFEFVGTIVKNTGVYFGDYGNNHHCIFEHNGQWYIAYHARLLAGRILEGGNMGYRSTHLDYITITEDGYFKPMSYTETGVASIGNLDPFVKTEAETIGVMAGIDAKYIGKRALFAEGDFVISEMETGDWILVYGADFKTGATKFTARVSGTEEEFGIIEIRAGGIDGEPIGYLKIENGDKNEFNEITVDLNTEVSGIQDIAFVFYGEGYNFDYWYFS